MRHKLNGKWLFGKIKFSSTFSLSLNLSGQAITSLYCVEASAFNLYSLASLKNCIVFGKYEIFLFIINIFIQNTIV